MTNGWHYTSNPQTIWALPKELRLQAVTEMVRRLSCEYVSAVERDRARDAQEAAAGAIMTLAGLFPDRDDPTHHLMHGIVGAIVAARSGSSSRHILLRRGSRVSGTRGGYGDALVKGFAVAGSQTLFGRGMSANSARKYMAQVLGRLAYSRRSRDHEAIVVTASAIRRWEEEVDANPIPAAVAPGIRSTIEHDILANNLSTLEEVKGLIEDHARAFIPMARAY